MSDAKQKLETAAAALGLTMTAAFVPFSASRNAKPDSTMGEEGKPWPSLNWRVTLIHNGAPFLETDYSQGIGHCPATSARPQGGGAPSNNYIRQLRDKAVAAEIETGTVHKYGESMTMGRDGICDTRRPIDPPSIADLLYSLSLDSSVLDSGGFENWAAEFGYNTDSRKAESIYSACLETALKLRAAIGEAGIEALRQAGKDY